VKSVQLAVVVALVSVVFASPARADVAADAAATRAEIKKTFGFLPDFIAKVPDVTLPSSWGEMKTLQMNPETRLSGKVKQLIGLAVSSQVPCEYCIYVYTEFAKVNGATDEEIGEAVAMAGQTRNFSTYLNGVQPDEAAFRAEVASWVAHVKKVMSGKAKMKPIAVVDAKSATADILQTFGSYPAFMKTFPKAALASMWRQEKDVELGPTHLDEKTKSLIGIAVAAQIPCRYCVIADREFAKLSGTSPDELAEAIAMAGHVRNWSTLLNGMQVDKARFKKDIDRMVKLSRAQMHKAKGGTKRAAH